MSRASKDPSFRSLAAAGITPKLAILVTDFTNAEGAWGKVNRKPDNLLLKAKDPKRKAALAVGGSHPLRRAADAAWAKIDRAEKAIRRYRPRSWAELVVQMRFDAYLGKCWLPRADELLTLTIADAKRFTGKGGAA
jgi:hypothetical protein